MKNLIIAAFAVLLSLESGAQLKDIEIIWGEPYKSKKTIVTDIISAEGGEIYAVKQKLGFLNQDVFIDKFKDLEPIQSNEIVFDASGRVETSKNIIKLGGELWMLNFTTSYEHANLQARFIEKETLSQIGETVDVFSVDVDRKMRYSYGGFDYALSQDASKVGFVTQYPADREALTLMGFQVFDAYFDPIWEKDFELSYPCEFVDLESMQVSNDHRIYAMIRVYEPKRINSNKRGTKFSYHIIGVNQSGVFFDRELALNDDQRVQSIHFEVTEAGHLIVGGFYGTTCCNIAGSFFMNMDGQGQEMKTFSTLAFDLDFIAQGASDRKRKKLERKLEDGQDIGFDNVDFREFITRQDGSIVMVGELYEVSQIGRNPQQAPTHFNYKDIIVVNIAANGQIGWCQKILKRQLTVDDGGLVSGFVMAVNDDKLHFIFNDHKDNLNVQHERDLVTYSRKASTSVVTMVTLDHDGEITREGLITQKELGLEIRPLSCEQVSDNELILFGMNRTENQFARLLF